MLGMLAGDPVRLGGAAVEDALAASSHSQAHSSFTARTVALVGFMGVGKTSVGRELAALLDRPFADTDQMVQARAGASIPELFARGEPVFRRLEAQAVHDALSGPPTVLALGGGAFSQPAVRSSLLEQALVVHLYTPWSVVREYLPELSADRPLLRDRASWQVQDLFLRRAADYRQAHVRVSLPRRGAREAATEVAAVLGRWAEPEPAGRYADAVGPDDGIKPPPRGEP